MTSASAVSAFARDVVRDLGLAPKQIESKYLYDALGIRLFEAICRLPWYTITRAEVSLLKSHSAQIAAELGDPLTLTELGPGDGEKIAILVRALVGAGRSVETHLIDVSETALEQTERKIARYEGVSVVGHRATYEVGLKRVAAARTDSGPLLVLFLGSNLGNFDTAAARDFLLAIRAALTEGDALLLGADLVKPESELRIAYDDPLGVTAAFNKNLLLRINRELDANFDLSAFEHRAFFNASESRVEMHLVSRRNQTVRIGAAERDVDFHEGETIWTESSYKYTAGAVRDLLASAGFRSRRWWVAEEAQFALGLFTSV